METITKFFRSTVAGPLVAFLVVVSPSSPWLTDRFLMPANLSNVSLQVATVAVVAIGATLVILTGGIDLSPGSTVALVTCTLAILVKKMGIPLPVGILLVLLLGVACGAIERLLSHLRQDPIIYRHAGDDEHLPRAGVPDHRRHPRSSRFHRCLEPLFYGRFLGIPLPFYYVVVLYALASLFLRNTIQGRAIYAVGGNASAARLTGIAVNRSKMLAFLIAGLTPGIGGVLLTAWLNSGSPNYGAGARPAVDRRGGDRRRQPGRRLRQHGRHAVRRVDGGGRPERAEPAGSACLLAGDHPRDRDRGRGWAGHVEKLDR